MMKVGVKSALLHSFTECLLSVSFFQSGGDDEPMSDNDAMSREGDSPPVDALARVPAGDVDPETLDKLRRQASLGRSIFMKNLSSWVLNF